MAERARLRTGSGRAARGRFAPVCVLLSVLWMGCGRGCGEPVIPPPPRPLTVETPRASCNRPDAHVCVEYLGFTADEAWVRSDCRAYPSSEFLVGSCPLEGAVVRCVRNEDRRGEQQDLYYAPAYSTGRAERSCLRRDGRAIVLIPEGSGEVARAVEGSGEGSGLGTGDGSGLGSGDGSGEGSH